MSVWAARAPMVSVALLVAVPVGRVLAVAAPHLHEADAALDQAARQQAAAAEVRADRVVEAVELLRRFRFAGDIGRFRRRHLHPEGQLVGLHARGQVRVAIARSQVLLVHGSQRVEQVALLFGLHAGGAAEIEDRAAAVAERSALVGRGQEALSIDSGSAADAGFEQDDEARQVAALAAETVEHPCAQARTADAGPAVVDQELGLGVRETFVVDGADDGEVVGALGGVRKQVGHFESGLAVLLECERGAEEDGILEAAVHEFGVSEAGGRMLAVEFRQQRLGIERVHVARSALHEQVDHALGAGG